MKLIVDDNVFVKEEEFTYPELDFVIGNDPAKLIFKYTIKFFETEGLNPQKIKCYEVIENSVEAFFLHDNRKYSLDEFKKINKVSKDDLIPKFNCHGYSLFDSKYWVDNDYATILLEEEYKEVSFEDCEVVGFFNLQTKKYEHTAKLVKSSNLISISDKQGFRKLDIDDGKLIPIQEKYPKTTIKYLKKI